VIVRVDEAGNDRHLLGVEQLRAARCETSDVGGSPNRREASPTDGERFGARHRRIHRVDLGVEHDEIGVGREANMP
jgi:hypothetical protein